MNSLKIPETGVMLKGSPGQDSGSLPQQAFAISLDDNVIEGMIKCFQDGGDIQLALGANPAFHYGSKSHRIPPPSDDHPYDLYLTQPFESVREAHQIPAMSLFKNPKLNRMATAKPRKPAPKDVASKPKAAPSSNSSSASNLDSDIEALQNGLAAHNAAKERSVLLSGPLPTNKKAAKMKNNKLSWGNGNTQRAVSTSPALKPAVPPSPNPAMSSQERSKLLRAPFVHELAISERPTHFLEERWGGEPEDFMATLSKMADEIDGKWTMKKPYWKELDVWRYEYDSQEDRDKAIDNAIRAFDKQRLSASEPEWDKLNRKEDRGKGICLSRLQANLARGPAPAPPKIKVQKAEGGSTPRDDAEGHGDKTKAGGENMARSSSNPLPKAKKITGSEAQAKRLLGNSKAKTAASKASTPKAATPKAPASKASTPKTSPAKAKATGTKANGSRVLSQEFIENSDSSGDEAPAPPAPKPPTKAVSKPAPKPVSKVAEKAPPLSKYGEVASKPAPKPAPKRPIEDEDSSSSSGTPLSKRLKPKQPLPSQPLKKRPVEKRQALRDTGASSFSKSKNTSPTKSSPLASSPPTNASDLSEEDERRAVNKKRKANGDDRAPPSKRHATDVVPADVISQAHKFKVFYEQYETLHYEISALDNPPQDKLADLRDMRERLAHMKEEIYRKCRA